MMLSICCITYNQEEFIANAIEGFLIQKTNFDFEIVISDDCSTDRTMEICKQYANKNPLKFKLLSSDKNIGMIPNFIKALNACKSKYIAFCEGDDYWTDICKLQKQVDFLEANPDYTICWTKYKILYQEYIDLGILNDPGWLPLIENLEYYEKNLDNLFNPYTTYTVTALLVKDKINLNIVNNLHNLKDDTIYCMSLSKGRGAVLNFFSSVYRVHKNSSYSSLTLLKKRYSNFLNIEEVIKKIENCNTSGLKNYRNTMLLEAFNISVKDNYSIYTSINLYYKIILYCKMSEKINASRQISKGFLAKISRRLQ